jgi:hypothetical protein
MIYYALFSATRQSHWDGGSYLRTAEDLRTEQQLLRVDGKLTAAYRFDGQSWRSLATNQAVVVKSR